MKVNLKTYRAIPAQTKKAAVSCSSHGSKPADSERIGFEIPEDATFKSTLLSAAGLKNLARIDFEVTAMRGREAIVHVGNTKLGSSFTL